jgi:phosphofructokinase-like protein
MSVRPVKNQRKRIGVLTSGGDCAGLNAIIRAVTYSAKEKGWDVVGFLDSTDGMLARPVRAISLDISMMDGNVLRSGGTMLGTSSRISNSPLAWTQPDGTKIDRSQDVADAYHQFGLSALVVIGGDGSIGILREVGKRTGIKIVGIPKTIDNDIGATETTVGFHTAVSVATEALDRLQPTAASHQRVMILEVMGRDAGYIALHSGIAGGADVILIPEIPYQLENVTRKIATMRQEGRMHSMIVVSEAVKAPDGQKIQTKFADGQVRHGGIGQQLATAITNAIGAETRVTVLGHIQRGGQPTATDRLIATTFGAHAVELIANEQFDNLVIWEGGKVTHVPLEEALEKSQNVASDDMLVTTARAMGICLGDQ